VFEHNNFRKSSANDDTELSVVAFSTDPQIHCLLNFRRNESLNHFRERQNGEFHISLVYSHTPLKYFINETLIDRIPFGRFTQKIGIILRLQSLFEFSRPEPQVTAIPDQFILPTPKENQERVDRLTIG
jgi:hypothetical protein